MCIRDRFSDAPTGELLVQAIPWADVRIGKKALGPTPLAPIRLAAGRYTVTLTQGTLSREVAVVVGAGARAVLRQKMAGP